MAKHEKSDGNRVKKRTIISIIIIGILFIVLSTGAYLYHLFLSNSYVKDDSTKNNVNDGTDKKDYKEMDGITNILLIGNDARTLDEKARADAILILSIDNIHKKVKITSIMRDSYVKIPGHGEQKINHSFALGEADLLRKTIEENFKIKLDNYAIINFKGFEKLVDAVGGLDINVTKEEMKEMNKFIPEVNPENPHLVKQAGMQRLDGQQALSYVRIRKLGNGDYDRTKRQREVISLLVNKISDVNVLKYPMMASKLLPYFKTNMDISDILNYAYTVYRINNFKIDQIQMPVTEISEPVTLKNKGWVLIMDKEQNAKIMHDFIFDDKIYSKKDLNIASFKKVLESYKTQIDSGKGSKSNKNNYEDDETELYEKYENKKQDKYNKVNKNSNTVPKDNSNLGNKNDTENKVDGNKDKDKVDTNAENNSNVPKEDKTEETKNGNIQLDNEEKR